MIGEDTYLDNFWAPEGKLWSGESTGHQFGRFYRSGFADTYRLADGEIGYMGLFYIEKNGEEWVRGWEGPVLYGKVGDSVDLSTANLPEGYALKNPHQQLSFLPETEDGWFEYEYIELKQIPKTTTRRITYTGLPEGLLEDVIQEVKWHWEWREEDEDYSAKLNKINVWDRDGIYQVYQPQGHYEAFTVPTVPGYQASVTTVAAEHVDSDEDILELNNAETVTVHYTKLSTGSGEDGADGGNTSGGSSSGSGNVGNADKINTSTSSADGNLPQTGSVAASGLAALGLGLLGLLGINWGKRRRS